MNIRPIQEEDIEQVIRLFRLNYGDDYAIPEFYDPQWVKRGIYSDNIIWLVIEDEGRVVASGAAIMDYGDYNDQIAEIGRLVVDPSVGGRGLGRSLLDALVDASDDRVEFAFGEARTTHIKTQRIFDHVGLVPFGFLPMMYKMMWRESWVLCGQLFNTGRRLRQNQTFEVIPQVAPIAALALQNLEIDEPLRVRQDARPYPLHETLSIEPLSGAALVRLLKIEQGRLLDPEVFSGLHIDQGITQLQRRKATYLVAMDQGDVLGAVGYILDGRNARIVELIARDDSVKGSLLRCAVEQAEQVHEAELIDCDLSAASPRIQRTMLELGFLPVAYIPGMVFHNTARWDVVKMMKLNLAWELGPLELNDPARAMFDLVAPAFVERDQQRRRQQPARRARILQGLTPLELDFVQGACVEGSANPGDLFQPQGLAILLEGCLEDSHGPLAAGDCCGVHALIAGDATRSYHVNEPARWLHLGPAEFESLCARHPKLGLKLYRNLVAELVCKE